MAAKRITVVGSVKRDLDEIAKVAPDLAESGLAAMALTLARELDKAKNSATSKSMCARALADVLDQLRELTPEKEKRDGLDEIADRRAQRLAGEPAA